MTNVTTNTLSVIRAIGGLDALSATVGVPSVLARRDEALLAIDEHKLVMQSSSPESIDLTDPCACTSLATGLAEQIHLDLESGQVVWPSGSQVRRAALDGSRLHKAASLPSLPGKVVRVVPARQQRAMLLIWQDDSDFDMLSEHVAVFDPETGRVNIVDEFHSNAPLWAEWCEPAAAWLVFDAVGERLWRVPLSLREPATPLLAAATAGGAIQCATLHPTGRWIALLLGESDNAPCRLIIGEMNERQPRWQPPFALPAGMVRLPCWHPTERLLAFDRGIRKKGLLTIVNARGAVVQECPLPAGWFSHSLAFSSCGRHVFVANAQSIGVWNL